MRAARPTSQGCLEAHHLAERRPLRRGAAVQAYGSGDKSEGLVAELPLQVGLRLCRGGRPAGVPAPVDPG